MRRMLRGGDAGRCGRSAGLRRLVSGGSGVLGLLGSGVGLLRGRREVEAARLRHRDLGLRVRLLRGLLASVLPVCLLPACLLSWYLRCLSLLSLPGRRVGAAGLLRGGYRARGAEAVGQRADLVEDLHRLVLRAGLGQHLDGGGQRLARARGRTEAGLRVRLQQPREHLPERLGDALRSAGCAVCGEVLDERLCVGLLPLEQIQGDEPHREEVRGKSGSAPIICSGAK